MTKVLIVEDSSDQALMINGHAIPLDGGQLAKL